MQRPSLAREPARYSTLTLGASTPIPLVHGQGAVSDSVPVRAQTETSFRSLGPGKHVPDAAPSRMQL